MHLRKLLTTHSTSFAPLTGLAKATLLLAG